MNHNTYANAGPNPVKQYSLAGILGIWVLAAIPMGILSWIVFPALSPDFNSDPLGAGVTRIGLITIGLVWTFVFSLVLIRQEAGHLRWDTVRQRLRLTAPLDPKTDAAHRKLWLWAIPAILVSVAWDIALVPLVQDLWLSLFPFLAEPPGYNFAMVFESPEIMQRLVGAWWFLGLFFVSSVFNILGEELLFRGVLLPRMQTVFGKGSWVANGVLFGLYHVHQPWGMAGNMVGGAILAYPSWRFRSTWLGIIVHSVQNVFFGVLILGVVVGLA